MERTEEILRQQLEDAMEDGKYRILLHRTYTEGAELNEEGITKEICTKGLKVFEDNDIAFSTSDYKNDINQIMHQIKVAYTYKSSDKVFILKIPVNALEYIPGKAEPILLPTNETNQFGNKCSIIPSEYIIGYVETLEEGFSTLKPNTVQTNIGNKNELHFTSSILRQYRQNRKQELEFIKSDRTYTDAEKVRILKIWLKMYNGKNNVSKKLEGYIKKKVEGKMHLDKNNNAIENLEYTNLVERFYQSNNGRKITPKAIEQWISTPRLLKGKGEIHEAVPRLIAEENKIGGPLPKEKMIQILAEVNGMDATKMAIANNPKITTKDKIKSRIKLLFSRKTKMLNEYSQSDDKSQNTLDRNKVWRENMKESAKLTEETDRNAEGNKSHELTTDMQMWYDDIS